MRSPWHETPRRRALWIALIAAVALAHGLLGAAAAISVAGWGQAPEPRRIDVSLVRVLEPSAPPAAPRAVAAAAPARPANGVAAARHAHPAASAPSAPEDAASAAQQAEELKARALALAAALEASAAAAAASAPGPAASTAVAAAPQPAASDAVSGSPTLNWPPSTRLTYTLSGLYRGGPLFGNAMVEWRRDGDHYQVEFNIHIAPAMDWHMMSDGRIGDDGLAPHRYDESRQILFAAPRHRSVDFGDADVLLSNGKRVARLPQTQDSASQFVQFVWMFTMHPDWLKPGGTIEIPLALPTSLRSWQYQVGALESLEMPFGAIDAVHLTPNLANRKPNEYPFEIWTAPTLRYLPVRVRVLLDDQNFAVLTLDSKPLQEVPDRRLPRPDL